MKSLFFVCLFGLLHLYQLATLRLSWPLMCLDPLIGEVQDTNARSGEGIAKRDCSRCFGWSILPSVTIIQWSGSSRQHQAIPWVEINSYADVIGLSDRIADDPSMWRNFSTAIGEALGASLEDFEDVADCTRKVLDVSGDGVSNEGVEPRLFHANLN